MKFSTTTSARAGEAADHGLPLGRGDVHRDRALVAVGAQEVGAQIHRALDIRRPPLARVVAARGGVLDLEHVGAEIAQHLRAGRPREDPREVEHDEPRERARRILRSPGRDARRGGALTRHMSRIPGRGRAASGRSGVAPGRPRPAAGRPWAAARRTRHGPPRSRHPSGRSRLAGPRSRLATHPRRSAPRRSGLAPRRSGVAGGHPRPAPRRRGVRCVRHRRPSRSRRRSR